ncbi:hypothetical protein D3C80_1065170 [compost metagenome]
MAGLLGKQGRHSLEQGKATTGHDALGNRCTGSRQGVIQSVLARFHLGFGGCAHADDSHATGKLGQAFLKLLPVVITGTGGDLRTDLRDTLGHGLLRAFASDQGGAVFEHQRTVNLAQLGQLQVVEIDAQFSRHHCGPRKYSYVLKHFLAPITIPGSLHRHGAQHSANLIDHQCGQGFAVDVLGDHHQRLAALGHLFEQWQQVSQRTNLVIAQQYTRIGEFDLHLFGVGDKVRGHVPPVETHAIHDVDHGFGGLGFLHAHHAFHTDLFQGVGDQLTDQGVVVGGQCGHLGFFPGRVDRTRLRQQCRLNQRQALVQAALEVDGTGPGHHVSDAIGKNCLGQYRRRAGAIADRLRRALGCLAQHLGAEVLVSVLQVDAFGDGHAIVTDSRATPGALHQHRLRLGAQGDAYGIGELGGATEDLLPCR